MRLFHSDDICGISRVFSFSVYIFILAPHAFSVMAGLELLSDQGFRIDGRKPQELRKIQCRLGVFTQADGSAYIEQGNTKVLAAVYGPHEVHLIPFKTICLVSYLKVSHSSLMIFEMFINNLYS